MRPTAPRLHGCLAGLAAAALLGGAPPAAGGLRGDPAAAQAVDRMLDALGGRDTWAAGRTLELEYRVWVVDPRAQRLVERAWRDLVQPNQRVEVRGESTKVVSVFTPAAGWRRRDATLQEVEAEQLRRDRVFWHRDYYTLLRRLAAHDPDLSVVMGQDRRVVVHSDRQGELGWFEIASDGAPVRWGTMDGGDPLEYVYGPLRQFGPLRFPAWGTNADGTWRFEYTRVTLVPGPIPAALLTPPADPEAGS